MISILDINDITYCVEMQQTGAEAETWKRVGRAGELVIYPLSLK
jgi:hypothetical protein